MKTAAEKSGTKSHPTLSDFMRSGMRHVQENPIPLFCVGIAFVYYSLAITDVRIGWRSLFSGVYMGTTFNSVLAHLFQGRFDVDPAAIGVEAFVRDGKTYTYFGIFTAFLRLPLWLVGRLSDIDITTLSCVVASCLSVYFKTLTISSLRRMFGKFRFPSTLFWALILATLFGGPQVQFLKASIYQEVVCWAAAIAAAYVYCIVNGIAIRGEFPTPLILLMSVLAGLELVNRISTGIGLYAATTLLLLIVAWQSRRSPASTKPNETGTLSETVSALARSLFVPKIVAAAAILLGFALICGFVNYGRWGNPLVFMPNHFKLDYDPPRIARLDRFGEFNIQRLWFGLLYYFLPIWTIIRPDGQFLFQPFQSRLIDELELPPSSFFITDPLLLLFVGCFFWHIFKFRRIGALNTQRLAAVLAGFTVPIWLICTAIYLAFRYRVEFYPFLDLCAFLGLYAVLFYSDKIGNRLWDAVRTYAPYLCAVQIGLSHALLFLYKISPFGFRSDQVLSGGWLQLYSSFFAEWLRRRFPQ